MTQSLLKLSFLGVLSHISIKLSLHFDEKANIRLLFKLENILRLIFSQQDYSKLLDLIIEPKFQQNMSTYISFFSKRALAI